MPSEYGNPEINKIVDGFKDAFGTTKTTKYDRFAAKRLADRHGADLIVLAITALSQRQDLPYAPVVRNISQLEEKWVSVIKFLKSHNGSQVEEL
jgi:hypothetical protein